VFREVASGAKTDRNQLRRVLEQLAAGDVLVVTRLDRLARSTRDLLNTLAAVAAKKAGFRSLSDAWADTTTAHGRLMLTVLGGLAEFSGSLTSPAPRSSEAPQNRAPQANSTPPCDAGSLFVGALSSPRNGPLVRPRPGLSQDPFLE
jgi:hypothetical protein